MPAHVLVSLDEAKSHLRLDGTTEHDCQIRQKTEEATAICLDWLKNYIGDADERQARYDVIDGWTTGDVPPQVRAAILRMLGHLFQFRGDDDKAIRPVIENGDLPADVTMFLKRLRDPALA